MYGLTRFPVDPSSRLKGTNLYCKTACCFEIDGWSRGISAIVLSLPNKKNDCR